MRERIETDVLRRCIAVVMVVVLTIFLFCAGFILLSPGRYLWTDWSRNVSYEESESFERQLWGAYQQILEAVTTPKTYYARMVKEQWSISNLTYLVIDRTHQQLYTNNASYNDYSSVGTYIQSAIANENNRYILLGRDVSEFDTNLILQLIMASEWSSYAMDTLEDMDENPIVLFYVNTNYPVSDAFSVQKGTYETYRPWVNTIPVLLLVSFVMTLFCLVIYTMLAGRKTNGDTYLTSFDRWKTEIAAIGIFAFWGLVFGVVVFIVAEFLCFDYEDFTKMHGIALCLVVSLFTSGCFLYGYGSLVRRIKSRTLWSNSLCKKFIDACLKVVWKVRSQYRDLILHVKQMYLKIPGIFVLWLLFFYGWQYFKKWGILMSVLYFAVAIYYLKGVRERQQIVDGMELLAQGELHTKISVEDKHGEQIRMAQLLNEIQGGLEKSVEKSLKSERMKTELITNVSHDLKTPLTSIINYVDLMKQEEIDNPKVQEYLQILEAKAQRMKILTEDVVEASKVSSGNVTLEYSNVNMVELIRQVNGEFEERFCRRGLILVQDLALESAVVRVDSRKIWRIFENLYLNTSKYAMEGTRVYINLWEENQQIYFSMKNISEEPLNIQADELTERFIRGDKARTTEGSGLGLSIAKSLTQLQGGRFELYLDGDLFKVTVIFPKQKS
jgi:signal transduction histidine kinase